MNITIFAGALALQHQKGASVQGHQRVMPSAFVQRKTLLACDLKTAQRAQVGLILAQGHQQATARAGQRYKSLTAPLMPFQQETRTLRILRLCLEHGQDRLSLSVYQVQGCRQIKSLAGALVDLLRGWRKQLQNFAIGRKSFCSERLASQADRQCIIDFGVTWVHGIHHDR